MTAINLNPSAKAPYEVDQTGETTRASGAWSGPRVKEDAGRDLARQRLAASRPALAIALENRLKAFDQALSRFSWPTDLNPLTQARLITPTDSVSASAASAPDSSLATLHSTSYLTSPLLPPARLVTSADDATAEVQAQTAATDPDPSASNFYQIGALSQPGPTPRYESSPQVQAQVIPTDQARPYSLYYSRGFAENEPTSLTPGDYTVNLTLTQGGDTQRDTLSVAVETGDTNGDVLDKVAQAANSSSLPIQARVLSQTAPGLAEPWLAATGSVLVLDLNPARSTAELSLWDGQGLLAQSLDLTALSRPSGPAQTGTTSLTVNRTYSPTAFRSNGLDPGAEASLTPGTYTLTVAMGDASYDVDVEVSSGDTWKDVLRTTSRAISATGLASAGVRQVTRYSGQVTDPDYYPQAEGAALTGEAVAPRIGERLSVTGGAMTLDANGDAASSTDNLRTALGLVVSDPGSDAVMTVNGRTQVRAPGVFQLDQGRVEAEPLSSGGGSLPLSVTSALERLSSAMNDVVAGYNGLRSFLVSNQDLLRQEPDQPDMAARLRDPLVKGQAVLNAMGLSEWGARQTLAVDSDRFLASALGDPSGFQEALEGNSGLLTSWRSFTSGMLGKDLSGLIIDASRLENAYLPSPRLEADPERTHRLVDLLG